jgi:hypothetical protein
MNMAKHTPAPWPKVSQLLEAGFAIARHANNDRGYHAITLEANANAHVATAAPELLDALERLHGVVDSSNEHDLAGLATAMLEAKRVIAKARGGP